mmetsp:Transcript_18720/g.40750  ORF Transcript_18720/g.40750 Transcript_18720/m.40750 type:complete len:317 (+) Transcript_18720:1827-2777(+)
MLRRMFAKHFHHVPRNVGQDQSRQQPVWRCEVLVLQLKVHLQLLNLLNNHVSRHRCLKKHFHQGRWRHSLPTIGIIVGYDRLVLLGNTSHELIERIEEQDGVDSIIRLHQIVQANWLWSMFGPRNRRRRKDFFLFHNFVLFIITKLSQSSKSILLLLPLSFLGGLSNFGGSDSRSRFLLGKPIEDGPTVRKDQVEVLMAGIAATIHRFSNSRANPDGQLQILQDRPWKDVFLTFHPICRRAESIHGPRAPNLLRALTHHVLDESIGGLLVTGVDGGVVLLQRLGLIEFLEVGRLTLEDVGGDPGTDASSSSSLSRR